MVDETRQALRVDAQRQQRRLNGELRDILIVCYGDHVVEAVVLDMADQWDFMEIAGSQLDNQAWVNTALLATSVIAIDGVPQPPGPKSRDQIRTVLRKLGEAGLDALQEAFGNAEGQGQAVADAAVAENAAGN